MIYLSNRYEFNSETDIIFFDIVFETIPWDLFEICFYLSHLVYTTTWIPDYFRQCYHPSTWLNTRKFIDYIFWFKKWL